MDLWDLTRLLFRRWYFALPILLVSVLTAVFASQSVKPDYRSTGNVVMIPAPGDPLDSDPVKSTKGSRPKNPWLDLGFNALGSAAILKVMDQDTLKSLSDAGLTDSITVQLDIYSPIFLIEAVGKSPAQATATVRQVIKLLTAEVAAQQQQYGAKPQDTITTLTLTDGADVETVTSKVKRVLIVTFGLGLMLTAAGTIGLDALLRWRRNRRPSAEDDGDDLALDDDIDGGAEPAGRSRISPRFVAPRPSTEDTQVISRVSAANARGAKGRVEVPTGPVTRTPGRVVRSTGRSNVPLDELPRSGGRRSAEPAPEARADTEAPADAEARAEGNGKATQQLPSSDATVILPLPRSRWTNQDERSSGR
jgi:capsular polysaccharide biosynthesis protein